MIVASRRATPPDIARIEELYRLLEAEMVALKPLWDLAEGLAEPLTESLHRLLDTPDVRVYLGTIDSLVFGFLVGITEDLLPQANGARVATVKYLFTEAEVREVGIAEAMMQQFLADARADGIERFDAHVSPGHRLAKNFFEANGFKARHIVMHSGPDSD